MNLNPQVAAALIGALLAGVFAFVVGWTAHRRETRRRDVEWSREKLLECYSNCVYYLIKLSISSSKKSTDDKDVRQHFSEAQRYLILLSVYHHSDSATVAKLNDCNATLCTAADKTAELAEAADGAVEVVKSLMEQDRRVQLSH
jgi:hypothetical protein